ncbi:kinesin-like protein KIF3B [Glandiceps talaboti]
MDVETFGWLQSSEEACGVRRLRKSTLATKDGTAGHEFQILFKENDKTTEVYDTVAGPLVNSFLHGFNCSVLCFNDAVRSSSSSTEYHNGQGTCDIMSAFCEELFYKLSKNSRMVKPMATLEIYELCKHKVNDLLEIRDKSHQQKSSVEDMSSQVRRIPVKTSSGATAMLKQAWSQRRFSGMKNTVTVFLVELEAIHDNFIHSTKSWFTIIDICMDHIDKNVSEVKLVENMLSSLQLRSGQDTSNTHVNYGELQFISLLHNILGGNCCTSVVIQFQPHGTSTSLLTLAKNLAAVKNYPLINSTFAEVLLTKYQNRIDGLEQKLQHLSKLYKEEKHSKVKGKSSKKRDDTYSEEMANTIKTLQEKTKELANAKMELSTRLVNVEEEKIAISKELVDVKIENNHLTEDAENQKYELTNRCLVLENSEMELSVEIENIRQVCQTLNGKVVHLKKEKQELIDDQEKLRSLYMRVVQVNETQADNAYSAEQEKLELEKRLFGTSHYYEKELHNMRSENDTEQRELENLVGSLTKDLENARAAVQTSHLRFAEQNTA